MRTDELNFSVLTAPIAAIDRRALSQAWYSALYGTLQSSQSAPPANRLKNAAVPSMRGIPAGENARSRTSAPRVMEPRSHENVSLRWGESERRAPRSLLARKIERVFLRPRRAPHKASFDVDGGRVKVLLHSDGAKLRLVAICPSKAATHVAAALAHARYSLALRGIDLASRVREVQPC